MKAETFEPLWRLIREPNCPGSHDFQTHHADGKHATASREWRFTDGRKAVEKGMNTLLALPMIGEFPGNVEVTCLRKGLGGWVVTACAFFRDEADLDVDQHGLIFEHEVHRCPCGEVIEERNWDRNHCDQCLRDAAERRVEEARENA